MARPVRRQHFVARFYLRNFAEPLFSDNLCVYDLCKRRWQRRTPNGVGWFPHLCSIIDTKGTRTDEFDQFLNRRVEVPATPALKKLAVGETLDASERPAIALFLALTAARNPQLMNSVMDEHLEKFPEGNREEQDELARIWCDAIGRSYNSDSLREFVKPGALGGMWNWAIELQYRLLHWEWHVLHTSRQKPFVTSDWPVFAQWDPYQDVRLVSFPVSSEYALIIVGRGQFNEAYNTADYVYAMNRQTINKAVQFVVSCKNAFPADEHLIKRC